MSDESHIFSRTEMLVGAEAMERLRRTKVIVFGLGGVGSWCAEALVRSGVGHLTLVDPDGVDVTNINRQLPALTSTIGRPKVEVLRERFLDINPEAEIIARQERFTADSAASFSIENFDYVIDAIDSIEDKLELILLATAKTQAIKQSSNQAIFFSSMGAARKMDPQQVQVTEFWKVDGCPLAATLRKRMRKQLRFPERKFKCVWSPERNDDAQPKGTMMPVTATFGLTLASLILRDIKENP
jgi:tRNA A37 threonylcarbamoyladenosine dehydratase